MHQSAITPAELDWTGQIAGGLRADLRRRWPHYASDFRDGLHRKVLASTLFLFVACLANAVAFGALNGLVTGEQIGIVEMLLMTALGGIVYALFSGHSPSGHRFLGTQVVSLETMGVLFLTSLVLLLVGEGQKSWFRAHRSNSANG